MYILYSVIPREVCIGVPVTECLDVERQQCKQWPRESCQTVQVRDNRFCTLYSKRADIDH